MARTSSNRNRALATGVLLSSVAAPVVVTAQNAPRERLSLNADWRFQKDDPAGSAGKLDYEKVKDWVRASGQDLTDDAVVERPVGNPGGDIAYTQSTFDDRSWRRLNLPHDWGIEGPFKQEYPGETGKLPWWGIGWYRKSFNIAADEKGRQFFLDIDGAMSYAMVWLNGQFVGGWPYGYSSFRLDLTPHIKAGGKNTLAIRLDNPPDSSRWYPGGGIYRNVWLVKTSPVHIGHWGTTITTPQITRNASTVDLKVKVENPTADDANLSVQTRIYEMGANGQRARSVVASTPVVSGKVDRTSASQFNLKATVPTPKLWDLQKANLYAAVTSIRLGRRVIDSVETTFGIRTISFDANKGFFLNQKPVRFNGVCNHHDLGALGAGINLRAMERQIELLKEMGCNAIRTSHNPPAPEFLDLCDRMGILVMDEFSDTWKRPKKPNGYGRIFDDWHEKDVRAMVRRDRNHPSIVMWSTGNEVPEQGTSDGKVISSMLTDLVRAEDPTRPVTSGMNHENAGYNGFQSTFDVFGYNYKPGQYRKFHEANPDLPILGSETASTVSSRGEYFFPFENDKSRGRADFQVSSYDLYAPGWAMPPDWEFKGQDENPFVPGEFVWTGFDYLGEPTPYNDDATNLLNFSDPTERARMEKELKELGKIKVPSRSSYFGILDLCGFKKDRFYIYQARWRPDFPMAHLLPHWNWPERIGEVTPVHVYTSGDEAELFVNGQSQGRKKKGLLEYRLRWDDVKYLPGEVRVVAYKKGRKWAEDVMRTTGQAARIGLQADRQKIKADGEDLSFVTVTIADKDGLMVPRSQNRVSFEITGPAEIVAVDNGDATDLESFQAKNKKAYNGLCLVIVRTKAGQSGQIKLRARAEGLTSAEITLISLKAPRTAIVAR